MAWNQSNQTVEAFHLGTCAPCDGPIEVGQTIQKTYSGRWQHYNLQDCADADVEAVDETWNYQNDDEI
jgi:hypothetical protein